MDRELLRDRRNPLCSQDRNSLARSSGWRTEPLDLRAPPQPVGGGSLAANLAFVSDGTRRHTPAELRRIRSRQFLPGEKGRPQIGRALWS